MPGGNSCVLPQCRTQQVETKFQNCSLFRFPKDPGLRQKWLQLCGLTIAHSPKIPRLCSKHFSEEDIVRGKRKCTLKSTAVPKVFNEKIDSCADNNQKKTDSTKIRSPKRKFQMFVEDVGKENGPSFRGAALAQVPRPANDRLHATVGVVRSDFRTNEEGSERKSDPEVSGARNCLRVYSRSPPPLVPLMRGAAMLMKSKVAGSRSPLKDIVRQSSALNSVVNPRANISPESALEAPPLARAPRKRVLPETDLQTPLNPLKSRKILFSNRPLGTLTPIRCEGMGSTTESESEGSISINSKVALQLFVQNTEKNSDTGIDQKIAWMNLTEHLQETTCDKKLSVGNDAAQEILQLKRRLLNIEAENARLHEALTSKDKMISRRDSKIRSLNGRIRRLRGNIDKSLRLQAAKNISFHQEYIKVKKTATDDAILAILRRIAGKDKGEYSDPHLRAFALSLHFYSPAGYRYLRKRLGKALPCESTLKSWYKAVDGEPGFTQESFNALHILSTSKNRKLPVSLMVDDMSIRKKVDVVSDHQVGFVDLGTGSEDVVKIRKHSKKKKESDSENQNTAGLATDICVFMVVCLDQRVKIPVAYFLHDKLTGSQLAKLAKRCIRELYDVGIVVKALVADGATANRTMARLLGADIEPVSIVHSTNVAGSSMGTIVEARTCKPYFPHPTDPIVKVYFIMDVCHMLKLIRNALAGRKVLKNSKGEIVSWHDITSLHYMQLKEGLRLGNRLTGRHIKWFGNKMKVTLAAQTLSRSVAQSLIFCEMIDLPDFKGASITAQFLKVFNDLFDVLNSYSKFSPGLKASMTLQNESEWSAVFEKAKEYIYGLKIKDPKKKDFHSVFQSKRKVGFQGFLVAIEGVKGLFDDLVRSGDLQYLCTYKLSQDHLESFFGKIRQRRGSDNNPSALHFKGSYKRLLLGAEITTSKVANVLPQDAVKILNFKETRRVNNGPKTKRDVRKDEQRNRMVDEFVSLGELFSTYADPSLSSLSKFALAVVSYVSGFVVKTLSPKLECDTCKNSLKTCLGEDNSGDSGGFIALKTIKNGLTVPTKDVVLICTLTEEYFRKSSPEHKFPNLKEVLKEKTTNLSDVVFEAMTAGVFTGLQNRMHVNGLPTDHIKSLIHDVCKRYYEIRTFHLCRLFNDLNVNKPIRHNFNKLILFNNQ